ncbi:hypothetical protein RBH29_04515 [Herbivorax sp. ANBcel31]|uniref:hypothetical protein n=1 Tax=Herbivorax sp. ANBcel31 TaxID=3069754 RepID=UPI0027B1E718|nr:hypothetical protein [Herbivorax sp. ANBcel31]MDQ2085697.1 hypothetical protein [Herbivorax sp. ANBcel31]
MQGIAKALLTTILVTICMLLFTNLIFFFPWYMTLIIETFNISQVAASDNYIKQSYYDDAMERLSDRPIFRENAGAIEITAINESGTSAIGNDNETYYEELSENQKPYRQRGTPITVEISAVYPLTITLWGEEYERELPVSFSITTTGLKHYKDLDYYFE